MSGFHRDLWVKSLSWPREGGSLQTWPRAFAEACVWAEQSLSFLNWKKQRITVLLITGLLQGGLRLGLQPQKEGAVTDEGELTSENGGEGLPRDSSTHQAQRWPQGCEGPQIYDPATKFCWSLCRLKLKGRRDWFRAVSFSPLPHPHVPGHVAPLRLGPGGENDS